MMERAMTEDEKDLRSEDRRRQKDNRQEDRREELRLRMEQHQQQQQQMAMLMALMSGRNPQNRGEEEKKQN